MKIAIIGGGISGLATYLNLEKQFAQHPNLKECARDITIYESHILNNDSNTVKSNIPSSGGGYGLAANGMASLRRLKPSIHACIVRNSFPAPKTVMKSARGWTIGVVPFNDLRGDEPECMVMVLRQVVLDALCDQIPDSAVVHRKVMEVKDGIDNAAVMFDNGETETFDLVIGADGVWSTARRAILGDKFPAEYKGLFTVGGFVSTDFLPKPPEDGPAAHCQSVMTLGPNGFFGYSPYMTANNVTVNRAQIRGDATIPAGEMMFWWSRSAQKDPKKIPDNVTLKRELEQRHMSWKDPTIRKIVQATDISLQTPTWVLPGLPTWAAKRVVLVGDAAHALPSSSGQGVSQALEDAEALSLLLTNNLNAEPSHPQELKALEKTFKQYMTVRKAHLDKVRDAGNKAGDTSRDMGPITENLMYGAFWAVLKLFGPFFMKPLLEYDVVIECERVKQLQ